MGTWYDGMYYQTNGACASSSYPYEGTDSSCRSCSPVIQGYEFSGYNSPSIDFNSLRSALMSQPVKVSVYAETTFQMYTGGILSDSAAGCFSRTNHAVIAVGYGSGFVKIRNSWGSNWGEGGYIRI